MTARPTKQQPLQLEPLTWPELRVEIELQRVRQPSDEPAPPHVVARRAALADVLERAHRAWTTAGKRRAVR